MNMNLSPIGTAYQASRNQSFNGIGGAAQSGMDGFMQMFGQVAEKRKAGAVYLVINGYAGAWTLTKLNALQMRIQSTDSIETRATTIDVTVDYSTGAGDRIRSRTAHWLLLRWN